MAVPSKVVLKSCCALLGGGEGGAGVSSTSNVGGTAILRRSAIAEMTPPILEEDLRLSVTDISPFAPLEPPPASPSLRPNRSAMESPDPLPGTEADDVDAELAAAPYARVDAVSAMLELAAVDVTSSRGSRFMSSATKRRRKTIYQ